MPAPDDDRNHPGTAGPETGPTALVIIDMLSDWKFPDAEKLVGGAMAIAPRIAALKGRCRSARMPVIYANDNHGRWRSDLRQVVDAARRSGGDGARIAGLLAPEEDDYFVLKPKHSAFHATPLELLLRHLKVRTLWLTGVSSDQCVLYSAADAKMNDHAVVVPRDCVATQSDARNQAVLRYFEEVLGLEVPLSTELGVPEPAPAQGS
jgi:nicotinamidase-related amidase